MVIHLVNLVGMRECRQVLQIFLLQVELDICHMKGKVSGGQMLPATTLRNFSFKTWIALLEESECVNFSFVTNANNLSKLNSSWRA